MARPATPARAGRAARPAAGALPPRHQSCAASASAPAQRRRPATAGQRRAPVSRCKSTRSTARGQASARAAGRRAAASRCRRRVVEHADSMSRAGAWCCRPSSLTITCDVGMRAQQRAAAPRGRAPTTTGTPAAPLDQQRLVADLRRACGRRAPRRAVAARGRSRATRRRRAGRAPQVLQRPRSPSASCRRRRRPGCRPRPPAPAGARARAGRCDTAPRAARPARRRARTAADSSHARAASGAATRAAARIACGSAPGAERLRGEGELRRPARRAASITLMTDWCGRRGVGRDDDHRVLAVAWRRPSSAASARRCGRRPAAVDRM